jgi:hypothetical protein
LSDVSSPCFESSNGFVGFDFIQPGKRHTVNYDDFLALAVIEFPQAFRILSLVIGGWHGHSPKAV